jgi:hypothetical protein
LRADHLALSVGSLGLVMALCYTLASMQAEYVLTLLSVNNNDQLHLIVVPFLGFIGSKNRRLESVMVSNFKGASDGVFRRALPQAFHFEIEGFAMQTTMIENRLHNTK